MNKFKTMQTELNRKNKEIERLKAMDGVKFSERLEKQIKVLEKKHEYDLKEYSESICDLKKDLAKCIKERKKLEGKQTNAKK